MTALAGRQTGLQWAGHTQGVRVTIADGGFDLFVAHRLLQRLDIHPAIQSMGGVSVAQLVRQKFRWKFRINWG